MKLVVDKRVLYYPQQHSGMMDSRFDVNFHIKSEKMRNRNDYSSDFSPGHYNLTASMKMTQVDNFRLIKSYRQIYIIEFNSIAEIIFFI